MNVNPPFHFQRFHKWIGLLLLSIVVTALLLDRRSTTDGPSIQLTQIWYDGGDQWASFSVYAPTGSSVMFHHEELQDTQGSQLAVSTSWMLPAGQFKTIEIQAPVEGAWMVRFFFAAPRTGYRLWRDPLRAFNVWDGSTYYPKWVLDSESITNAPPPHLM